MTKTITTKEKLLTAAKELFWTRGYSNVSVRQITALAGVDAALVSRYYDGKKGLFLATLDEIEPWEALSASRDGLLDAAVASFSHPFNPETDQANPFSMLLTNINDPEMGDFVKDMVQTQLADPLGAKISGKNAESRAAMLLAALFGMALMRKNFQLDALIDKSPKEMEQKIRHLATAALGFDDSAD